jgi:hypothetical protein
MVDEDVEIATMISILVKTSKGETVEISRKDLDLYINGGIKGFYYESEDGDLFIPFRNE